MLGRRSVTLTLASDFADANPGASVIGTDISPLQPAWVPPNCEFQLEDAQLDWTWPMDHFDLIHVRYLVGAIDDWAKLYRQAFDHLKPGGYFQHGDLDTETRSDVPGLVTPDHVYYKWCQNFFKAGNILGKSWTYPVQHGQMKELMENTGFEDVQIKCWKVPIGGWAMDTKMKEIGYFTLDYLEEGMDGFALLLFREILGWEIEDIEKIVNEMRMALRNKKWMPYFFV